MIIIGLLLSALGVGFVCWLLFTLAIYALPVFAGLIAALAALHHGSGPFGAVLAGVVVGAALLTFGRFAIAAAPSPILKIGVILLYAVPATIAGYSASLGLAHIGISSETWRRGIAIFGALSIGATAFVRMSMVPL